VSELIEIFKPVPLEEFKDDYMISNLGRVKSLKFGREHVMVTSPNSSGYASINLNIPGKRKICTVHRLVALVFIPNPENLPILNHKDGNKMNSVSTNLEWSTYSHNPFHAYETGLNYSKKGIRDSGNDKIVYHLFNIKTQETFQGLRSKFIEKYDLKFYTVGKLLSGRNKTTDTGWRLSQKQELKLAA
jgi:hypothetical protein